MKRKLGAYESSNKKPLTSEQIARIQANKQAAINRRMQSMNRTQMGFLGIEKKFYDTTLVASAIPAPTDCAGAELDPSATSMISTPAQGDGEQQRDGKQIVIDYVELKGIIDTATVELNGSPAVASTVYVALVLDTQTNGAQMNSEDCYKNTSATANVATCPLRNLLFGSRFRILKSSVFDVSPLTCTTAGADSFSYGNRQIPFHWFVPLKGLKVNFTAGTTASVANVVDNSLHIIAFTNRLSLTPTLSYNARIRFVG